MLLLGCDGNYVPRRTQVALENAKKRIARSYLAGLQKVEDCGKGLRFRLCIDEAARTGGNEVRGCASQVWLATEVNGATAGAAIVTVVPSGPLVFSTVAAS